MGVSQRLAARAASRTALLVAEVPGWGRTRCAVEAQVRRRGWRLATSPADADALVVCGEPGPRLTAAFELTWAQLPGPRSRATVTSVRAVRSALDQLHAELVDTARQRREADGRSAEPPQGMLATGSDETSDAMSPAAESSSDEPADRPSDGSGEGDDRTPDDHADMDMDHDMDMPMPEGIPLAGGGEDRDGLDLDVLHVPLGPVLPAWPAGLLVRCTLQGDVVTDAQVEVLSPAHPAPADEDLVHGSPAELLDRAARVLTIAGWGDAATAAARLRDVLLDPDGPGAVVTDLARLERRVSRSRMLRWSLGPPGGAGAGSEDVHQRLLRLLADARSSLDGSSPPLQPTPLDRLPALLIGQQLAAARLLLAAVDVEMTTSVRAGAAHA